jgi:hypothetical protein
MTGFHHQRLGEWNKRNRKRMLASRWSNLAALCTVITPVRAALLSTSVRTCAAPHPATLAIDDLRKECAITHTRGSGPGGQHRNKVQTAVNLKHQPTEVVASASEARSQAENMKRATFRLRVKLALTLRTDPPPVGPTQLWTERNKGGKLKISEAHEDFPSILSEALDNIWATQDVRAAAEVCRRAPSLHLRVSTDPYISLTGPENYDLPDGKAAEEGAGLVEASQLVASRGGTSTANIGHSRSSARCICCLANAFAGAQQRAM